ncbi:heavy-metal-associated domain-containing protein [Aureibaculum sp. 2210JD6-5]|uniref:heavy-metal-associated domain-containing protein n=1 Tax=Aureibaculum sp. 2210JD6-5 TaxID=3103957 RepID=UPI002AADE78A|nr:heavy-metal-associated domain-containing protein [Aureibaculum sp. 2210JD6-5]MDY7394123.1 heavy-metal-associated domain-containing protein [Aureibaculum sp. 2210JD6-5]
MSFLSENIIPGNHGKVFGTDAKRSVDLNKMRLAVLEIDGIKDFLFDLEKFPSEFTVHTSKVVKIETIQNVVKKLGFHAIPKVLFEL